MCTWTEATNFNNYSDEIKIRNFHFLKVFVLLSNNRINFWFKFIEIYKFDRFLALDEWLLGRPFEQQKQKQNVCPIIFLLKTYFRFYNQEGVTRQIF